MGLVDAAIIIFYLTAIVVVGVWSSRKAARSDDDYFLLERAQELWVVWRCIHQRKYAPMCGYSKGVRFR
jgi:Na+/proline symporter